jgi:hypothetical protein
MMLLLPTLADVITADMGFLPGFALFGPAFGLPLSVLAAVLERPFYTRAGITKWTIWFSLQANLISLLAGYLMLPIALGAVYSSVGLLWLPIAIVLSTVIERSYLNWLTGGPGLDRGWYWTSWANIASALAIVGVLMFAMCFNTPEIRQWLRPHRTTLEIAGISISVLVFLTAFVVPVIGRRFASAQETPP